MNKVICMLMLFASITGAAFAQEYSNGLKNPFDLPDNHAKRRFIVDLGSGNKMQIEVSAMEDLGLFANMDSVIRGFLKDITPLHDSLADPLTAKRIDHTTDSMGRKMIRFRQFRPASSDFLVQDGEVSALKLQQDTIHFIGTVYFISKYTLRKAFNNQRNYRVSFFLNDMSNLERYMDGSINEKIKSLQENVNTTWVTTTQKGKAILKADPSISAKLTKGFVAGGDFLTMRMTVNVQNYKNYFVPSFSLGAGLIISDSHFKRDIFLAWEPHFFFAGDIQPKLKTFRNDMLRLTYGHGLIRDNEPRKESHFLFVASLGYLVKREGDYFNKNTFHLGAGQLSLFSGKTKIEPGFYFNNFFKGVTPSVRLLQSF
jgi:hypothetical protein